MYTITIDDIKAYLATKRANEYVGAPNSPQYCLVAQALHRKYPGNWFMVEQHVFTPFGDFLRYIPVGAGVTAVIRAFDKIKNPTRTNVEAAIPELKGEAHVHDNH